MKKTRKELRKIVEEIRKKTVEVNLLRKQLEQARLDEITRRTGIKNPDPKVIYSW